MNTVHDEFAEKFPGSLKRYAEALSVFPSGVTHDSRYLKPFPIYISHAQGSRKRDVDDNEFVDYWIGHGALLLGHNHPAVTRALSEQLSRGTHYGASHDLEIAWGQWVQKLIPSAERVRFVSSGTEATLMAIRLARAFTGRNTIVRFEGHFHGWHDAVPLGYQPPFDAPDSLGVPPETLNAIHCLPPNDMDVVVKFLGEHSDVAGIILEPAGGAKADFDVKPDLTALAKILAGGLPGGAVAGRADILQLLDFTDDRQHNRHGRVSHPGTFDANPLSAAAGVSTLEIAATGQPQRHAAELTLRLTQAMNDLLRRKRVPGCVYGDRGAFHLLVGQKDFHPDDAECILDRATPARLATGMGALTQFVRAALLLEGIDPSGPSGRLSSAHTEADVAQTLDGFERALERL